VALILGFRVSAVVQAVVSHPEMASCYRRRAPFDRDRSRSRGGVVSCSYAAVALARACSARAQIHRRHGVRDGVTNLVAELSIIMLAFLGWELTLAEFVGAPIMSGCGSAVSSVSQLGASGKATDAGRIRHRGRMEGHAEWTCP